MEVNKIRIGNDIGIAWTIRRSDGVMNPIDQALNLEVQLIHQRNKEIFRPNYSVDHETVCFQFPALLQKHIGAYDLLCRYQFPDGSVEGGVATYTIDLESAFVLVSKTSQEDNIIVPDLSIVNIKLSSSTEQAIRGMSAYECARQDGFEGTITEWLESLKKPAVDAANSLLSVIDEVLKSGESALKLNEAALKALQEAHSALTVLVRETTVVKNETEKNNEISVRLINELNALIGKINTDFAQFLTNCQTAFDSRITAYDEAVSVVITAGNKQQADIAIVEGNRVKEEGKRNTAETGRNEAESNRNTAERERNEAETGRDTAERGRNEAESNRNNAERGRNEAETKRQKDTATAIVNAETATDKANKAAESVDQSINDALVPVNEDIAQLESKVTRKMFGLRLKRTDRLVLPFNLGVGDYNLTITYKLNSLGNTLDRYEVLAFNYPYNKLYNVPGYVKLDDELNGTWMSSKVDTVLSTSCLYTVSINRKGISEWIEVNGVKGNAIEQPAIRNILNVVLNPNHIYAADFTVYNIKCFNCSLDSANIYNQGRVFDIVLGDEWREKVNTETYIPTYTSVSNNYNAICTYENHADGVILSVTSAGTSDVNPAGYFKNQALFKLKNKYASVSIELIQGDNIDVSFWDGSKRVGATNLKSGLNNINFYLGDYDLALIMYTDGTKLFKLNVKEITIKIPTILDEFTPDSLIPTKWVNTAQGEDIKFTNPTFSYENPIKEIQWCYSTDTKPTPLAIGQRLGIVDTGAMFEVGPKLNTEQWSVNHYYCTIPAKREV